MKEADTFVWFLCGRFEQAFLNSLISEMGGSDSQSYWTALQDRKRIGEYRWLTLDNSSTPLNYNNWNRHQPGKHLKQLPHKSQTD